jgi:Xaa-Pro dipeptidase
MSDGRPLNLRRSVETYIAKTVDKQGDRCYRLVLDASGERVSTRMFPDARNLSMTPKFHLSEAFETAEYRQRIANLHREMARQDLDAVLLFSVASHTYLYNYDQIGAWFFQTLVVPRGGDPVAFVRHADQWLVQQSPFVREVVTWRDSDDDPIAKVVDIVNRLELDGKRIGLELATQYLSAQNYDVLRRHLEKARCTLVDASDLVGDLRLIKSPAEIERVRRAGRFMDIGFEAAFAAMRPGVTELDVLADAQAAMHHAGASVSAGTIPVASGTNTLTFSHYSATSRRLQVGDPVLVEIGGCCDHYHAVGAHTAFVNSIDSDMQKAFEDTRRTINAGRAVLGPGVPARDVARVMTETLDSTAREDWGIHFGYGTGIGMSGFWFERLRISQNSNYTLQPGMTFFLFSGRMCPDKAFILLGDPLLITETGFEDLSRLERDEPRVIRT